jgi:hypothetical protein
MNPIPLTHKRRVYAYACGRCLVVPILGSYLGYPLDPKAHDARVGAKAREYKSQAEACCRCSDCKAELAPGTTHGRCSPCDEAEGKRLAETMAVFSARDAQRAAHNREAMARASADCGAADRLLEEMRDLSERCYYAAWLDGLEHSLWSLVTDTSGDQCSFGVSEVSPDEVDSLRRLSQRARGWWRWDDDLGGEVFVPLDEWKKIREGTP